MRSLSPSFSKQAIAAVVLGSLVFIYLLLRCVFVPITEDEAATFILYIVNGTVLPGYAKLDANNHILNTVLSWISYQLFGPSEFALRLPNLLSFPFYAVFVFKIGSLLKNALVRWVLLLAMLCPYVFIEYFGLCRGYGMSMAFMVAGIWYLLRFIKEPQTKFLLYSFLLFDLGVLANLTLINSLVVVFAGIACYLLFFVAPGDKKRRGFMILLVQLIPIAFFIWYGLQLSKLGLLYYGTPKGLWHGTLQSLINLFVYRNHFYGEVAVGFYLVFIGYAFILLLKQFRDLVYRPVFIFLVLFAGNIILNIAANFLLSTLYPLDRAALYFFPLLIGCICFCCDEVSAIKPWIIVVVLPLLFFPVQSVFKMNLTHSKYWHPNSYIDEFYAELLKFSETSERQISIGSDLGTSYVFNYHNVLHDSRFSVTPYDTDTALLMDFYIVSPSGNFSLPGYKVINKHEISGFTLLRRESLPERTSFFIKSVAGTEGLTENEFFNILDISADTLEGKHVLLNLNLTLTCDVKPLDASLIYEVADSTGKTIFYRYVNLQELRTSWDGSINNLHQLAGLPHINKGSKAKLKIYIWNGNKVALRVSDASVELLEVKE